ncbi:hypothetical protein BST61_g8263 [Cercospora zeina]
MAAVAAAAAKRDPCASPFARLPFASPSIRAVHSSCPIAFSSVCIHRLLSHYPTRQLSDSNSPALPSRAGGESKPPSS